MNERNRRIFERIIEAERLEKKRIPESVKKRWQKIKCPRCSYEISYFPKEKWDGTLRCPECGNEFKIPRIDDFVGK